MCEVISIGKMKRLPSRRPVVDWQEVENARFLYDMIEHHQRVYKREMGSILDRLRAGAVLVRLPALVPH
jgi:hypothetical protein